MGRVKDFTVAPIDISGVRDFIETHHYSGNVNGIRVAQCFGLYDGTPMQWNLIGGMIYGAMGMANAWKKYGECEGDVIELRRLCCIDDTPKNTESYFIGRTLRWLKQNTEFKVVISYADAHYGHEGTIYKASNFEHIGMTAKSRVIQFGDRTYHDKTIRTYFVNKHGEKKLKPFAERVKNALENGDAQYEERPPKHIYRYKL